MAMNMRGAADLYFGPIGTPQCLSMAPGPEFAAIAVSLNGNGSPFHRQASPSQFGTMPFRGFLAFIRAVDPAAAFAQREKPIAVLPGASVFDEVIRIRINRQVGFGWG
jgi:hypothetical protein